MCLVSIDDPSPQWWPPVVAPSGLLKGTYEACLLEKGNIKFSSVLPVDIKGSKGNLPEGDVVLTKIPVLE